MPRAAHTHPFDVAVCLRLLRPAATIADIAVDLAAAPSQVHGAIKRLDAAGLLRLDQRATNARALHEFLLGGVRYAFPVQRGAISAGVPTAYSAPPLSERVDATDVVVWPAAKLSGTVRGFSIVPLYPGAPLVCDRDPETYRLLCLVDALRLGDPKLRAPARDALESLLSR